MKPLVDGVKPQKCKEKKDGIIKWLKTIAGIEIEQVKTKKKPKKKFNRKNNRNTINIK